MWSLLDDKDEITSGLIGHLLTFFLKELLVSIAHSLLDVDLKQFSLLNQSVPSAFLAVCGSGCSFTSTLRTVLLHLHLHDAHVDHLQNHSLAIAFWARLQLTVLGPGASAVRAIYVSVDVHLAC